MHTKRGLVFLRLFHKKSLFFWQIYAIISAYGVSYEYWH